MSDELKGTLLYERYSLIVDYARKLLASAAYRQRSGDKKVAKLEEFIAVTNATLTEFSKTQGVTSFHDMGVGKVGGASNELSVHTAGVGMGQREKKFFRPEKKKGEIDSRDIQSVAGVDINAENLRMVEREKAFYILSEFLRTGLAVPTREAIRIVNGRKVRGALLDQAKGRVGFDYNYRYMGINDYQEPAQAGAKPTAKTGARPTAQAGAKPTAQAGAQSTATAGAKPTATAGAQPKTHIGGELIYQDAHSDPNRQTVGQRMNAVGTSFGVKTTSMKFQNGMMDYPSVKGGTLNALDPHFLRDLNRLNLLDILAGHPDRHMNNFLIDADESDTSGVGGTAKYKGMTAIDNDAVFGSEGFFAHHAGSKQNNQTGIKAGMHMDKEMAQRIKLVAKKPGILQILLGSLLSDKEIAALTLRFQQLSKIIEENEKLEKERMKAGDSMDSKEAWNSYISRFMFVMQGSDEVERDTTAALAARKSAAEKAEPLNMDEETERLAVKAFIRNTGALEKLIPPEIAKVRNNTLRRN